MNKTVKRKRAAYKKYSFEFKDQALSRAKQGNGTLEQQKLQHAELAQLKRDNQRLTKENEFLNKVASARAQANERLTEKITAIFKDAKGRAGSIRITHRLQAEGEHAERHRVARLMNLAGMHAKAVRKFKATGCMATWYAAGYHCSL